VQRDRSCVKPIRNLFVMIGAVPNTEWLKDWITLDSKGYIVTDPMSFLETSQAGVFAVGDVRAGSAKRVAAAVGEGSVVMQYVHNYLATGLLSRGSQVRLLPAGNQKPLSLHQSLDRAVHCC
jgi:thioredoxin reductase